MILRPAALGDEGEDLVKAQRLNLATRDLS